MRIVAVTVGSHGDIYPFINLSKELQRRGHTVKIVTFEKHRCFIEGNDINYGKLTGNADELMDMIIGEGINCIEFIINLRKLIKKYLPNIKEDIRRNCKDADLILYTYLGSFTYHFAEANNIPCIRVSFWPDIKNSEIPLPTFPLLNIGSWYNNLSYDMAHYMNNKYTSLYFNEWREELKLGQWGNNSYRLMDNKPIPTLYAFSESIITKPREWNETEYITGYWFDNDNAINIFTPNKDLVDFIDAGDKPLYIGFGSMAGGDFKKLLDIIIKALEATGKRALFGAGWSNIKDISLPDYIYPIEYVPHDWLFNNVSAVIHHGGAGTTAAGLLAGCPTFIVPFGGDQKFWGTRIYELGLGPKPITRNKLTTKSLINAIKFMERTEVIKNAESISFKLKNENGILRACEVIENKATE